MRRTGRAALTGGGTRSRPGLLKRTGLSDRSRQMADDGFVIPAQIRRARRQHICDQCSRPIEPGTLYEEHALPPYREPNGGPNWWKAKLHRGSPDNYRLGCDEAAAYSEKAAREAVHA